MKPDLERQLRQLRAATRRLIDESPVTVVPMRQPLVSNPEGGTMRSGERAPQDMIVIRIVSELPRTQDWAQVPAGLAAEDSSYAVADREDCLEEGDQFQALGHMWSVGPVKPMTRGGKVYRAVARLMKGEAI